MWGIVGPIPGTGPVRRGHVKTAHSSHPGDATMLMPSVDTGIRTHRSLDPARGGTRDT